MTTIGTLFSGGEGVGIGARQAGLMHLWGVEYDDAIAQVARNNGFNTITGNVMDSALMLSLSRPDVLHASPVCKNASNAKSDGEESIEDIASADATCAYIDHFRPDIFTLENVYGYRTFTAFAHIMECLNRNGYCFDYWHLNAADYGVPQTRKRLILVARLHGKPRRPIATHAEPSKLAPLFDARLPWIGWYEAIKDLIGTLPASQFSSWQLKRLPEEIIESFASDMQNPSRDLTTRLTDEPFSTVVSTAFRRQVNEPRAFILDGKSDNYADDLTPLDGDDPVMVITGSQEKHNFRAFIPPFVNADGTAHERSEDEPIQTLQGTSYKQTPKAFIVNNQASDDHHGGTYGVTVREDELPSVSITNGFIPKAFIMPNANTSSGVIRNGDEPAPTQGNTDRVGNQPRAFIMADGDLWTPPIDQDDPAFTSIDSRNNHPMRAWLSSGRVVKMTPRALARFQSFPDSYILPDKALLACTVIGNAVPPLLYQRVIEAQL